MKSITTPVVLLAGAIIILAVVLLFKPMYQTFGAAFTGQSAYLQIATSTSLTANVNKVIATSTPDCKSRVITVRGESAVNLIFGDTTNGNISSTTLSGTVGHLQAASTTVVYDSGLYGCGMVVARSWADVGVTMSQF